MSIESETQLLSADFVMLGHLLKTKGFSRQQALSSIDISPETLEDPNGLISYAHYKQLILNAIELTGDTALGLEFGKSLNFTSSGALSMGVWACSNFMEAINLTRRIVTVLNPGIVYTLDTDDEFLNVSILESLPWGDTATFMVDVTFGFIAYAIHHFDPSISKRTIYTCRHDATPNATHYKDQLGGDVIFNADKNSISIPLDFCHRPLPFSNSRAVKQAEEYLEGKTAEINNLNNLLVYPIKLMLNSSVGKALTLEDVAESFHISPRTLNRRLKDAGTSFKDIVTEIRHERAVKYLKETTLSIEDIAYNLGYQDTSNFSKAFKTWTGMTPSQYRSM